MWKNHLIIGIILILLILPIYFLDQNLLKPGTSGWISLDFRGFMFWAYIIWIGLHLILSSLGVYFYQSRSLLNIHLISGLISIVLLVLGFFIYATTNQYISNKKYATERQERMDVIQLKEWWFEPNAQNPEEVHLKVIVSESDRVGQASTFLPIVCRHSSTRRQMG